MRELLWRARWPLAYLALGLVVRLLYVTYGFTETHDWYTFRLPIAERLSQGEVLYRDIPYDHVPLYPYFTGLAYLVAGDSYLALMSLAIVGDALIAPLLYWRTRNHWIAVLYVVSAVSIQVCGNARWDCLTVLLLLLALCFEDEVRFAGFTAVGICFKVFPAAALVRVLSGKHEWRRLALTVTFVLAILSPFLVCCPGPLYDGLTGHSVYSTEPQEASALGSFSSFLPYWAWVAVFVPMVLVVLWTFREGNYRNTVGILLFMAVFLSYVTHMHTGVVFIPFALLLMQRSRYWIFAYIFCQYFSMMRMLRMEEADLLFPLTLVIWVALVWENVRIARDSAEGPADILLPADGPSPDVVATGK